MKHNAPSQRPVSEDGRVSLPTGVILVDDHRLFRDGLRLLLSADARFEVVGEAACGEEFLELLERVGEVAVSTKNEEKSEYRAELCTAGTELAPNGSAVSSEPTSKCVVFMDIDMPGIGGVEATRRALEREPDMKIIALSMHGDREFYRPMVEAGASGFLLKNSEFAEVAAAAEKVAAGGTYFSPELMDSLIEAMHRTVEEPAGKDAHREPLSERETEVLPLVCEGMSNQRIADRLFISKRTVDKHRANILAKTGCNNTASLVIYAVKNNLIKI